MEEFGLEAKRHLLTHEASEIMARQYAEAFEAVMHHNNPYFWQFVMCEVLNFVVLLVVMHALAMSTLGRRVEGSRCPKGRSLRVRAWASQWIRRPWAISLRGRGPAGPSASRG